jgi:hypothetical protein
MALGVACSHDSAGSDSRQGNVRVKLSAAPITTTSPATTSGSATIGTTGASTDNFDGDDGDDDDAGSILSRLEHVNVTFSSLLARNLDGDLVDLVIALPVTVDLIPVISGHEFSLPIGTLPPGMYDQIVVVITQVEFVFLNGGKIALTPPGGGWTRIVPVAPFEVIDGQTTTIMLRLRTLDAFKELNGDFQFFPDFDCEHED